MLACIRVFWCVCVWEIYRVACATHTDDITMVICPGIGNHSEKQYIRTFVDHSQRKGYRCAVLNHLGALPDIELTSPRMFTYGKTPHRHHTHLPVHVPLK